MSLMVWIATPRKSAQFCEYSTVGTTATLMMDWRPSEMYSSLRSRMGTAWRKPEKRSVYSRMCLKPSLSMCVISM
eukprot:6149107-Prorocentrum_lima.AAC.1